MAKQPSISLLDFLRTGKIGGLKLGAASKDVKRVFGASPTPRGDKDRAAWVYKDLEFWINQKTDQVYAIAILGFSDGEPGDEFPRINHKNALDPWVVRRNSSLEKLGKALGSAGLTFTKTADDPAPNFETIHLESGVNIIFQVEPEAVIDAIGIHSDELAGVT